MLQEEISYNVVIEKDRVFVSILCKSNQNTLYACYLNDAYSILQKKNYQSQNQFEFQCSDGKYFCTLFVKENGATESPVFIKTTFFTIRNCKIFCVADYDVISILSEEKSFHISQGEGFQLTVEEDKVLLDLAYLAENKFDIAECLSFIKSYVYKEAIIILVKCYEDAQINEYVDGFINSVNKLRQGNVFLINMHQILRKDQCRIVHENYNTFQETLLTKLNDIISFCEKRDKENINVNIALNENILSSTVSYLGKSLVPASYFFYLIKDGSVYYKSEEWTKENQLTFELSESGIYCVQGYVKYNDGDSVYTKSHTVEFFTIEERSKFDNFLNDKTYEDTKKVPFFECEYPFEDFCIIQSSEKINTDIRVASLKLFEMGKYGTNYNYVLSKSPVIENRGKRWVCSGMVYGTNHIIYGKDMIAEFDNLPKIKRLGMYCVAEIGEECIRVQNDFFNFNRIFVYSDEKVSVIANRYHLLLLIIKKLGKRCLIDEQKALLTLSSANIQFLTQNGFKKMDMSGCIKCTNSHDVVLDSNGLHFVLNEYGEILNNKVFVNEIEYRKMLRQGCDEIISNIRTVLSDEDYKNVIVDLTGGMDSRIVYGAALQINENRNKIRINSYEVKGSNDLEIAILINGIWKQQWDSTAQQRKKLDAIYSDYMQRSFYMGTYYSHNLITTETKAEHTIRLNGACGEILLRPYIIRKYLGTMIEAIEDEKMFLDYILRDYSSEIITDYEAAKNFIDMYTEEFQEYGVCSFMEKIDRIYLEHRHAYHFDTGILSKHAVNSFMPLQSKLLFNLHHSMFDNNDGIKLQLDVTSMLDPYLASLPYDDERDNLDRKKIKSTLHFEKEYYREVNLKDFDVVGIEQKNDYLQSVKEKKENVQYVKNDVTNEVVDFYIGSLSALKYLCKHDEAIKNGVGIALWHYIESCNGKNEKSLRYLYNKLVSLKDQISIFEE